MNNMEIRTTNAGYGYTNNRISRIFDSRRIKLLQLQLSDLL